MSRAKIEEYIHLLNSAFQGTEQSVLRNLDSVQEKDWTALPDGARRSIKDIVAHIGMFKFMYPGSAFRNREFDYGDDPVSPPSSRLATKDAAIEWLNQAHAYLIEAVTELQDDGELDVPRKAHWGGLVPTRNLLTIVLEHDTYHSGEINRTRAFLQDDDDWPNFED